MSGSVTQLKDTDQVRASMKAAKLCNSYTDILTTPFMVSIHGINIMCMYFMQCVLNWISLYSFMLFTARDYVKLKYNFSLNSSYVGILE